MLSPRFVDSREHESRLVPLERAGFQPKRLDYGDVQFPVVGGAVALIECKKVGQLLDDMVTGQLVKQCKAMATNCDYPVLMPEGRWEQEENGQLLGRPFTWEQAWNELQTLQDLGIRLQLTTSTHHTIKRILELAAYYGKDFHPSAQRHVAENAGVAVLCTVRDIGAQRAKAILKEYGTLEAVVKTSMDELQGVDGLGPKLSRRVWDFWRYDWSKDLPKEKL